MGQVKPIFAMLFLLLAAIATPWCAAGCVAEALAAPTCHHEDSPKVCDDPSTLVPDASLPAPLLDLAPVLVTVVPVRRMPAVYPFGVSAPRPPLRL
jgi:hypothetical protein